MEEAWSTMKRLCLLLTFVVMLWVSLIPLTSLVFASSNTLLLDHKSFSVSVNANSTSGQADIPFNCTLTQYNGTFSFQYENLLNGIRTDTCYITQFSVYLDERLVVTKTFTEQHVQGVDVRDLNFTSLPGSYNGTLMLVGVSEGTKFYGTVSLMVTEGDSSSNGRVPIVQWNNSWLDFTMLGIIVGPVSVAIVLIVRRHRHRKD